MFLAQIKNDFYQQETEERGRVAEEHGNKVS